jgi:large subunit ribosomal protein L10
MALTKEKKQEVIAQLKDLLLKQRGMIFVDFSYLKSKDIFGLRKELKTKDAILKVVKKTLFNIALKDKNEIIEKIKEIPHQLAVVFLYKDEISPLKILSNFRSEEKPLKILGGVIDERYYTPEEIIEISQLPSREELFVKFLNVLNTPILKLFNVLNGNIKGLITVLTQIKS